MSIPPQQAPPQGHPSMMGPNQGIPPNMPVGMNPMAMGMPPANMGIPPNMPPNMAPPNMAPNMGTNLTPTNMSNMQAAAPNMGGPMRIGPNMQANMQANMPMAPVVPSMMPPNMMPQNMMFANNKKRKGAQPIDKWKDIPPNNTVYINNLNEKISRDELYGGLREVFGQYGKILDIVCYTKIKRCKGQAWVVFDKIDSAIKAVSELQNFSFYNKPMHVHFSKNISDATLKRDGKVCPRRERIPKSQRKRGSPAKSDISMGMGAPDITVTNNGDNNIISNDTNQFGSNDIVMGTANNQFNNNDNNNNNNNNNNNDNSMIDNELTKDSSKSLSVEDGETNNGERDNGNTGNDGSGAMPVAAQQGPPQGIEAPQAPQGPPMQKMAQMPEAAPNSKLFLRNLPPDTTEQEMKSYLFQFQGFMTIELVPHKPGIAFVNFKDIITAQFALPHLKQFQIRGYVIQAQYAH